KGPRKSKQHFWTRRSPNWISWIDLSEDQLQSDLDLAHVPAGRTDSPESDIRQRHVGFAPIRVVEHVERLGPEFQVRLTAEMNLLQHGKVAAEDARTDHLAAARRAERALSRSGVCGGVEPLVHGRTIELRADADDAIWTAAIADIGGVLSGAHGQRETGAECDHRGEFPATDHVAERSFTQIAVSWPDRYVVDDRRDESMALIEHRQAILAGQAIRILWVQRIRPVRPN